MRARSTIAACAAVAAVALAGCGSSKPGPQIPRALASDLTSRLAEADRRAAANSLGACNDLSRDTLPTLERTVAALPQNLDANVRTTVTDGISHLKDLVGQQCTQLQQQRQQQTNTTPTAPSSSATTAPPPPPTATQPSSSATQPPSTATSTPSTQSTPTSPSSTPTNPGAVTPPTNGPGNGQGGTGAPGQQKKALGGR